MKKFEEEFDKKVSVFHVMGHHNGICCSVGEVKAFGHGWVSPEDHQAEIGKLKSQLEKQQPEIPEVPQFMDEWFKSDNLENLIDVWYNHTADLPENVKDYLDSLGEDITTSEYCYKEIVHLIARAKLDGCTVKEKR
ncbi:hypothetical protein, partial [Lactococcus garvieae]|uniref:hypothetical protein n=1 Tax=Lactococcus garvieae TaxID=1363 RepID=UPI0005B41A71